MKSAWQEQRHCRCRSESRQNPNQRPSQAPQKTQEKVHRLQGHAKTDKQMLKDVHFLETPGPGGQVQHQP